MIPFRFCRFEIIDNKRTYGCNRHTIGASATTHTHKYIYTKSMCILIDKSFVYGLLIFISSAILPHKTLLVKRANRIIPINWSDYTISYGLDLNRYKSAMVKCGCVVFVITWPHLQFHFILRKRVSVFTIESDRIYRAHIANIDIDFISHNKVGFFFQIKTDKILMDECVCAVEWFENSKCHHFNSRL